MRFFLLCLLVWTSLFSQTLPTDTIPSNPPTMTEVDSLLQMANIELNEGSYEQSLSHFQQVILELEQDEDIRPLFHPYMNIGWIFFNLGEMNKSQEYLDKASAIAEELEDEQYKIRVAGNLATINLYMARDFQRTADTISTGQEVYLDSAEKYWEKAEEKYGQTVKLAKEMDDMGEVASILNNWVVLKLQRGATGDALPLAKEARSFSQLSGEADLIAQSEYNLGYVHNELGYPREAIRHGEAALKIAEEHHMARKIGIIHELLFQAYRGSGRMEKAIEHLMAFTEFVQEQGDVDRNQAIAEMEAKFQHVQQEKQILQQDNDILELENRNDKISRQRNYLIGGGFFLGVLSFLGIRFNKLRRERNEKKAFAEALIFAQEEERKRIARDLHDGVGQSLLLIKKQMETEYETSLENQELIAETLEEVRSISQDLHPFQLEKFGLAATLEDVMLKIGSSTDLFLSKELDDVDGQLSNKAEINVFRTVQEALSNIVKHSGATAAKVSLQSLSNEILLTIQDNGKGFDHELAVVTSKSLGLRTMHERIASIGGKLNISPGSPKGTKIEARIPKQQ